MSLDEEFILKGTPVTHIPDCSLAEHLVPKIRSFPRDMIAEVEADTGAERTGAELLARSIRLSEGLKKLGLKEDDVVGVLCRNSFEASEIVLGSWLSGAAVAPMPGSSKVAEIIHMLDITKPKFIFCDEEAVSETTAAVNFLPKTPIVIFVSKSKSSSFSHMAYEEVFADCDVDNYEPQPVKCPSSQLVAILFSSGTTGPPKGVGVTHRNLIFQHLSMDSMDALTHHVTILQISQFFWVTGILFFIRGLTAKVKRVLLKFVTPINVLKAIERYKVEYAFLTPSLALSITACPDFEKFDVSSVKILVFGGSPFTVNIAQKLKEKWRNVIFAQAYGTTEATGTIFTTDLKGGDLYALGKVSFGVQVKVVDLSTGRSVKANTVGEILVKSPGIMKGYVGNEKATKEMIKEEGWSHTGDLGYYDESGQVYLVDRIKELIKVQNYQVSPTEIENVIIKLPGVEEVGVVGVKRDDVDCDIVALVVKEKNSTITAEDIQAHVANTLSDYKKLTGGVYFADNIQKTPSGKIEKKELRKLVRELYTPGSASK